MSALNVAAGAVSPVSFSDTTPSGLPFVGDLRWGTHFSQFYETADDLRDCLVPFFLAGLANHEKCIWVTAEPFGIAEAVSALRAAVPDLDARIADGQIEIIDHKDWYLQQGTLSVEAVPKVWTARIDAALATGYAGLRVTGNAAFVDGAGWQDFMHYEETVHGCFRGRRVVALCSYPIGQCGFGQVLDVIRHHGFAVARRNGRWETIESAALATAKAELARANRVLEQRVEARTADLRAALAEREREAARARTSERWCRELLQGLPAAIYTTDAAGRITYYNDAAADLWGHRPELGEAQWCGSWRLFSPDSTPMPHDACPMALALKEGRPIRGGEAIAERPDGTRVVFIPYPTPLYDDGGALVGAVNMLVDITDRKDDEKRLQLLAQEVDHRARNMLAVVQAMVRFTNAETVADFAASLGGRVQALSHAHSLLSDSRWEGADLERLVAEELAPYRRAEGARAVVDGPRLILTPAAAQSLAMTVHELATNAAKYGALTAPTGRVVVRWSLRGDRALSLRWEETGGPKVQPPSRCGFGTTMVERTICDQLDGAIRFDWRVEGLVCEIEIPAEMFAPHAAGAAE